MKMMRSQLFSQWFLTLLVFTTLTASFLVDEANALTSCTHVIGMDDEFSTLEAALNAIGANGTGKVVCIRDNKTYPSSVISASGDESSYLIIKSHPQNSGRPKFSASEDVPVIKITGSYLDIRELEITSAIKNGSVKGLCVISGNVRLDSFGLNN